MKRIKIITAAMTLAALIMTGGCSLLPPLGMTGQEDGQPAAAETAAAEEEALAALTVGDISVPVSQARIYAFLMQLPMENAAGNQIWDGVHPDGGQFDDRLKGEVKKQITQITVIADKADQEGVALTEEETANADERAALLFEQYPGLAQAGTDEAAAREVYRQSMLAGKYYDEMTKDYLPDLTEEEKASCNVREVHQIFIAADDISHLGKNKDQKALAEALLKRAKKGESFDELSETYSSEGTQTVLVINSEGYAFDADAWVDKTFAAEAMKLKAGDLSGVFETDWGWHVLQCVSAGDPALCQEAMDALFEKKKQTWFADILNNDLSSVVVKEEEGWTQIGVLDL